MLGGEQEGRKPKISDEEHRSRLPTLKVAEEGKALAVKSVGLNKVSNGEAHFTSEYEIDDLVVRRGMAFDLTITFEHEINVDTDTVTLQLSVGARPQESKGTLIRLKLDLKKLNKVMAVPSRWSAHVRSISKDVLEVAVQPPPDSIVGKYQVFVESYLTGNDDKGLRRYELEDEDIFVIFNPWCSDDLVFMEDPKEREEYVLNDHGRIWVGSAFSHCGRPWNFGQFDNPCLEAAVHLLDKAELGDSARSSPISIVRAISALANSNDDNGVLEGRWTEKYPKTCTVPWAWTGSVSILEQFMEHDKPVKYGQCWVFSGIITTLLRALGIPTRSVTNFESAHDTDASMTIDNHVDEDGEPMDWLNDSVWNFHVWNESWFKRLDLPDGYDGWQAHDATPQELSEGVMRCGPAPLKAIKEGHVWLNYDVPFIFSEVNGDKIHWRQDEEGEMKVVNIDGHAVGKFISTKAVGNNNRHDLTHDYKYSEGTADERKVVAFVNRFSKHSAANIYPKEVKADVIFDLKIAEDVNIGDDVTVTLTLKNASEEARPIWGRMTLMSGFYTGVTSKRLKGDHYDVQLEANEEKQVELTVTAKEYQNKLNPEASLQLYVAFYVTATKQHFVTSKSFTLVKPTLDITVPDEMKTGLEYQATVTFTNFLSVNLTNAAFHLEGASVATSAVHEFSKAIKPNETVTHNFFLKPRRAGEREIEATFSSDQLSGVDGSVKFEVKRNIEPMDTE